MILLVQDSPLSFMNLAIVALSAETKVIVMVNTHFEIRRATVAQCWALVAAKPKTIGRSIMEENLIDLGFMDLLIVKQNSITNNYCH